MKPKSIEWVGGPAGHLRLLDQTELPREGVYKDCHSPAEGWEGSRALGVRGAPPIGVAAAFGLLRAGRESKTREGVEVELRSADGYLRTSRPTAVNLFWALDRMLACLGRVPVGLDAPATRARLLE